MNTPQIVIDLAASVSGVPTKWREEDNYWVIIMTDGRKYRFPKEGDPKPRNQETPADYKPGIDQTADPEHRHRKNKPKD